MALPCKKGGALDAFWRATDLTPREIDFGSGDRCFAGAVLRRVGGGFARLSGDPTLALTIADSIPCKARLASSRNTFVDRRRRCAISVSRSGFAISEILDDAA